MSARRVTLLKTSPEMKLGVRLSGRLSWREILSSLQKDEFDVPTALSRWVLAQNE